MMRYGKNVYFCNMNLSELSKIIAKHPFCKAFSCQMHKNDNVNVYLENLQGSASALLFSTLDDIDGPVVIVLNDEDEAGFFYQDLATVKGEENVLFFPSGYRRDVKFGRTDEPGQILRTEVIGRLGGNPKGLTVVTYPQALAVRVRFPQERTRHSSPYL